jgi:uncharacterized protein
MRISEEDKNLFISEIRKLHDNEHLFEMNQYIQHGNTTTLVHCLVVAYYSYITALRLPFHFDTISLIRGAMLHDFYLYDWHTPDKSHKLHGFRHPNFALINARKFYHLNPIEEDIIKKHMWPLTLTKAPLCKEALLVCMIDKYCSLTETLYLPVMPKEMRQLIRRLTSKGLVI